LRMHATKVPCIALLLALSGCGSCGPRPDGTAAPDTEEATEPAKPDVPVGIVEGVVRLAEGTALPFYPEPPPPKMPPSPRPDFCPPPKRSDRQPVSLGANQGLQGLMVNAIDFKASPAHEPVTHEVVVRDCMLEPRLVVATRGDKLRVRNETNHPFLPKFITDAFTQALAKGQDRLVDLDRGGVHQFGCFLGSTCGRTDVIVLYHPVHTTTGKDGRFRLANVPANQDLTVHAWHPLFDESSAPVKVAPGKTVQVEITLTPRTDLEPEAEHPDP
jgi:hypothetical protein